MDFFGLSNYKRTLRLEVKLARLIGQRESFNDRLKKANSYHWGAAQELAKLEGELAATRTIMEHLKKTARVRELIETL